MADVTQESINARAAMQDAEERKLKRKSDLHGVRGGSKSGVSFDDSAVSETPDSDLKTNELSQKNQGDSKTPISTREIRIISDGTYAGTQVFIDGKRTQPSDMKIFISKTSGFVCKITQEVNLF